MPQDLFNRLSEVQSIAAQSATAALNGSSADLQGFESAEVVINAGTAGGTSPSFTFELQESDDDTTFTAVAAADLQGTEPVITTANDAQLHILGYQGTKRYIRVAITTVSGTSPTLLVGATIVRGHARHAAV